MKVQKGSVLYPRVAEFRVQPSLPTTLDPLVAFLCTAYCVISSWESDVNSSAQDGITKYHRLYSLNNKTFFPHSFGSSRSKIKVPARLGFS